MQFAFIIGTPGALLQRRLVESSDPDDLAARVQLALNELGDVLGLFLAAVNLSGAGDGDKWVIELVAAPSANLRTLDGTTPPGATVLNQINPGNLTAVCYKAADVTELAVQRDRALGTTVIESLTLETLTGAAQGLQHMGLILAIVGGA